MISVFPSEFKPHSYPSTRFHWSVFQSFFLQSNHEVLKNVKHLLCKRCDIVHLKCKVLNGALWETHGFFPGSRQLNHLHLLIFMAKPHIHVALAPYKDLIRVLYMYQVWNLSEENIITTLAYIIKLNFREGAWLVWDKEDKHWIARQVLEAMPSFNPI